MSKLPRSSWWAIFKLHRQGGELCQNCHGQAGRLCANYTKGVTYVKIVLVKLMGHIQSTTISNVCQQGWWACVCCCAEFYILHWPVSRGYSWVSKVTRTPFNSIGLSTDCIGLPETSPKTPSDSLRLDQISPRAYTRRRDRAF